MKIEKKDNNIVITFPSELNRVNPYDPKLDCGTYPTFIGLIVQKEGYNEYGLAHTIDMCYKGKADQFSSIVISCDEMGEDEFKELCDKLEISIVTVNEKTL